jgi:nuclear pore complex protein Nup93
MYYVVTHLTRSHQSSDTYRLAQTHVDASALSNSIAHLTVRLQPSFRTPRHGVRIAHKQNPIFTIEEGRRETQDDYRILEERSQHERKNRSLKNWAFVLLAKTGVQCALS